MKNKLRQMKGITLIALVITIIVLLILAGVSIATLTGENGILTQANNAKNETKEAEAEEMFKLIANEWQIEKRKTGADPLKNFLDAKVPDELDNVNDNGDGTYTIEYKGYQTIINSDGKLEGEITKAEQIVAKEDTSGAIPPVLRDGMQAITFTSGGTEKVVTDTSKNDWYSYEVQTGRTDTYNRKTGEYGTSHWANAKLNGNYYVWIPRYAYKIYNTEGEEGYEKYTSQSGESYRIDVKFVGKDVTNKNVKEKVGEGYIVHPAFLGTDTVMSSGSSTGSILDKELSGIWVGKYESSDDGSGNVKIIPNATSYTGIDVATMFTKSRALSTVNNNVHMLKNTEWGALAYLAQSQYGRNGTEISVNESEKRITGAGRGIGTETDNPIYNSRYSTDPTSDQKYNGKIGKLSSTTGNIYGVYDMSGGAYEYVAGCLSEVEDIVFGITRGDNTYVDLYKNFSYSYSDYTAVITGDATNETAKWNGDESNFVFNHAPAFYRGGGYYGKDRFWCV